MLRLTRLLPALALFLLLGGCVPGVSPGTGAAEGVLVFPGGWIAGRWAHQGDYSFSLPAQPLDADAAGDVLGVLYPYSWQLYQDGQLKSEHTLPYPAKRLHARPAWVAVLERGLFTATDGWLDYPAADAANTSSGLFWVNDEGLWRGSKKVLAGEFERVLELDGRVLALAADRGVYWPDEDEIDLPPGWTEATAADDLYLLTPEGLYRYDPAGYELGFYPGSFNDLAAGPSGVWLAAADGRVIHLTPQLEEAW